jgi:hypothetical protein
MSNEIVDRDGRQYEIRRTLVGNHYSVKTFLEGKPLNRLTYLVEVDEASEPNSFDGRSHLDLCISRARDDIERHASCGK